MYYFDNSATSFPKPEETVRAVTAFLSSGGGNPGRGGNPRSIEASRLVFETREDLAGFINAPSSERIIFTGNGTESLNLAILGLLQAGDHIVTTGLEHNSVMRPLDFLKKTRGVEVDVAPVSSSGHLDLSAMKRLLKRKTHYVIVNHGSNVLGTVQDLSAIRDLIGDRTLIVDACQTIANVPIDVEKDTIDVLCFSCHKALFGIQGLGAIYIKKGVDPTPLIFGGTGSNSEFTEQPEVLPDKYESGTLNTPAIAGLSGGLQFIRKTGMENIAARKRAIVQRIYGALKEMGGIELYNDPNTMPSLPILLFNIKGKAPSDVGYALNRKGISVRVGLHCSPLAHTTAGTFPGGAVRVSPGYFTTDSEIEHLLEVIKTVARS